MVEEACGTASVPLASTDLKQQQLRTDQLPFMATRLRFILSLSVTVIIWKDESSK